VNSNTEDSLVKFVQETIKELESIKTKNQIDQQKCRYHFGYLAEIPSDFLIPEECITCSKVIKCKLHLDK
jgi:hypothetical protein